MRVRWPGLALVVLLLVGILEVKHYQRAHTQESAQAKHPAVLMIADLSEASETNDVCADIIRAVRDAGQHGIAVKELTPDADPELLKRYRVLAAPTVLILDRNGNEVTRFEGEEKSTLVALRTRLAMLQRGKQ